jgi:hypothetical protein
VGILAINRAPGAIFAQGAKQRIPPAYLFFPLYAKRPSAWPGCLGHADIFFNSEHGVNVKSIHNSSAIISHRRANMNMTWNIHYWTGGPGGLFNLGILVV